MTWWTLIPLLAVLWAAHALRARKEQRKRHSASQSFADSWDRNERLNRDVPRAANSNG